MGCTNCKKKAKNKSDALKAGADSILNSLDSSLDAQKLKLTEKLLDGSTSILNNLEKVGVTIFAWIPLAVGYYYIIKFIISLF
mgnify:CR=1 FL=1|jgi:hypothetical protein|tara:strand:+ start:91 stop:339 length:249 start_codon:yes stop_codon:yes gene_type:complete